MELPELNQTLIFFLAAAAGAVLGVVYDIFRFLRAMGLCSFVHTFIQDILFMSIAAVCAFFFAVAYNNGEVRVYTVAGHLYGLLAYRFTIGLLTGRLFHLFANGGKAFKHAATAACGWLRKCFFACKRALFQKNIIFYKNCEKKKKNNLQLNSSMVYNKKKFFIFSRACKKGKGNKYV